MPPSLEYATLAFTCHATASCSAFFVLTAIAGSLKKPALGVMSARCALGGEGSCWADKVPASSSNEKNRRFIIDEAAILQPGAHSTAPVKFRGKSFSQLFRIGALPAQCPQAQRVMALCQTKIVFIAQQRTMKIIRRRTSEGLQ